jgi:hypothetical protein
MKKHIGGVMVKRLEESKDVNTGAPEGKTVPFPLMKEVVLLSNVVLSSQFSYM